MLANFLSSDKTKKTKLLLSMSFPIHQENDKMLSCLSEGLFAHSKLIKTFYGYFFNFCCFWASGSISEVLFRHLSIQTRINEALTSLRSECVVLCTMERCGSACDRTPVSYLTLTAASRTQQCLWCGGTLALYTTMPTTFPVTLKSLTSPGIFWKYLGSLIISIHILREFLKSVW